VSIEYAQHVSNFSYGMMSISKNFRFSHIVIVVGYCSHESFQIRPRVITLIFPLIVVLPVDWNIVVAFAFASIIIISRKVDGSSTSLLWMVDL